MTKEERKAYMKAWREAHKEQYKVYQKAWRETHKEQCKATMKAYRQSHKEEAKAYYQANKDKIKAYMKEYMKDYLKSDLNSLGQTKDSIRWKSRQILKKMNFHIPGYQTHHCFGYEDPNKFIYISKELHLKIHKFLRDNNIDADSDHWMAIRDIVNSTDEFTYIKC